MSKAIVRGGLKHRILVELAAMNTRMRLRQIWENLGGKDGSWTPEQVHDALVDLYRYGDQVKRRLEYGADESDSYEITWQGVEELRRLDAEPVKAEPVGRAAWLLQQSGFSVLTVAVLCVIWLLIGMELGWKLTR